MISKIISEKNNPLLERREIIVEVNEEITPSKDEVRKIIGADENLIVVKKISANFGRHSFVADVFVYNSEEAKNKIETIPKKVRKKLEEEKKAKESERLKKEEEEKKKAEENLGGNETSQ